MFNLLINIFKFRKIYCVFCIQNFSIPFGNTGIYNGLFLFVSKSISVLFTFHRFQLSLTPLSPAPYPIHQHILTGFIFTVCPGCDHFSHLLYRHPGLNHHHLLPGLFQQLPNLPLCFCPCPLPPSIFHTAPNVTPFRLIQITTLLSFKPSKSFQSLPQPTGSSLTPAPVPALIWFPTLLPSLLCTAVFLFLYIVSVLLPQGPCTCCILYLEPSSRR